MSENDTAPCLYCTKEFEDAVTRFEHQDMEHNIAKLAHEGRVNELVKKRVEALQMRNEFADGP